MKYNKEPNTNISLWARYRGVKCLPSVPILALYTRTNFLKFPTDYANYTRLLMFLAIKNNCKLEHKYNINRRFIIIIYIGVEEIYNNKEFSHIFHMEIFKKIRY